MIKPLPGYVLIEPIEDEGKSSGGLYLPDSSKDKPMKGKIISVGGGIQHYEREYGQGDTQFSEAKEGDIVVYKKWTNQEVVHEGKEYLLVGFNELLAII